MFNNLASPMILIAMYAAGNLIALYVVLRYLNAFKMMKEYSDGIESRRQRETDERVAERVVQILSQSGSSTKE